MPGRPEQEPTREEPRLVPQPDGYADYRQDVAGPGQHRGSGGAAAAAPGGHLVGPVPRRHAASPQPPRRRQRSIRSTITMLLIVPLVSLIGLWAYAAWTTVGGALTNLRQDRVNQDIGGPLEGLLQQMSAESSLTYLRYNLPPVPSPAEQQRMAGQIAKLPPSELRRKEAQLKTLEQTTAGLQRKLQAQRPKTDAAITAFINGQAKAEADGSLPAQLKPVASKLVAQLRSVPALRARADARKADALSLFKDYNAVIGAIFPYVGGTANIQASPLSFTQAMGTIFMGQALADVSTEIILGNGALETGGVITKPVYQLFQQTVTAQRQLDQAGATMLSYRYPGGTDSYVRAINSPQFKAFQGLEDKIVASGPNAKLPATQQQWLRLNNTVLGPLQNSATVERLTVTADTAHQSRLALIRLYAVGGAGLLAVVISTLLLMRFGGRVSRELRGLRAAAQGLAFQRLPGVVSRLRVGEDLDPGAEAPPLHLGTKTLEVTETAEAFSAVQRTAMQAAIEQAMLRKAVSNVFRRLARRNQGLLQRQLKMLDEMERGTHDPDALGQLFRLDHLTTRMRRQAEGLIILSGAAPGRGWRQPVQVVEVLRGAIGEIEDYVRVDLITDSPDYLQGAGVADVTHLLAELIENAVAYSPPTTRVQVRGGRVANGYVVEIEDRGLGIPAGAREVLNQRLAEPPDFDVADSDQLGLFVVSRLAARHGIRVSLRPSTYGGTTAIVLLPQALVVSQEEAAYLAAQEQGGGGSRRQTGPINTNGSGGGRMAAAVGAAADALTGRRHRPDSGSIPSVPASGPMTAPDGSPPLPSRADRRAGTSFPGAAGGHPSGSGRTPNGFPEARDPFAGGPGTGPFRRGPGGGQGGGPGAAGGQEQGAGPAGLPRRERMANLAPQLREEPPNAPRGPLPGKSPEQARSLLSSIQRGLRTGRDANLGNGGAGDFDGRERR